MWEIKCNAIYIQLQCILFTIIMDRHDNAFLVGIMNNELFIINN